MANIFELRTALETAEILGNDDEAARLESLIEEQIQAEQANYIAESERIALRQLRAL